MDVRTWWNQATERDQDAVLYHVKLDRELAGIPWPFLPEEAQQVLTRRVKVNETLLAPDWQRRSEPLWG